MNRLHLTGEELDEVIERMRDMDTKVDIADLLAHIDECAQCRTRLSQAADPQPDD